MSAAENNRDSSSNDESQSKIQVKEGTPTDDELEELGIKIAKDWIKLGRRLEVSDPDTCIEEIDEAHDRLSQKGYHMLKHWKQEKGSAATYQALCEALQHPFVQRKDLAEKFCYKNVKPAGKRESSCSSNHPDAKRTRLAGVTGDYYSDRMYTTTI